MSFDVVPPRLKIDDLIEYFGYQHNARGYNFIFDMINYYGLPVYAPLPPSTLHKGDYLVIPELINKFDFVITRLTKVYFNERNYGLALRNNYYKESFEHKNTNTNIPNNDHARLADLDELVQWMRERDKSKHIRDSDSLYIEEVLISGNRLKCFTENEQGEVTDHIKFNYEHCYAKGNEIVDFKKNFLKAKNHHGKTEKSILQTSNLDIEHKEKAFIDGLFPSIDKASPDHATYIVPIVKRYIEKNNISPSALDLWLELIKDERVLSDLTVVGKGKQASIVGLGKASEGFRIKNLRDCLTRWKAT